MVAQQNADFDQNKAMEVMESMMQAHPDIDAVFCGNDAMLWERIRLCWLLGRQTR